MHARNAAAKGMQLASTSDAADQDGTATLRGRCELEAQGRALSGVKGLRTSSHHSAERVAARGQDMTDSSACSLHAASASGA